MNQTTRQKLSWGWLRLFLGQVQMFFAAGGMLLLLTIGLHWITWVFVGVATAATITSRILYRGQASPKS